MMNYKHLIYLLALLFPGPGVWGNSLRLPNIIGNHMVLQQNAQVNVWGWASPGDRVNVKTAWDEQSYTTNADQNGDWRLKVQTGAAGGPYTISFTSDTTIIIEDILLGEVWICSGQSNMEWPLNRAESGASEVSNSLYPDIRLFTVEKRIAARPRNDVQGHWERCRPEIARNFSAVAYFFGKNIHQQLRVPVGLIHTSWGGTPSQAWTSKEALENFDFFYGDLKQLYDTDDLDQDLAENKRDSLEKVIKKQSDFLNPGNVGFRNGWMQLNYDDDDWLEMQCPAEWSTIDEIGILEGVVWMRTSFVLPDAWIGKNLVIELGPIDEMDVTYLNGRKIGSSTDISSWDKERIYKVPGQLITQTECVLAIRIVNTLAEGGIRGKSDQLKIYPVGDGSADPISLAGTWKYQIAYEFPKLPQLVDPKTPTVLYNGMLYPLKNLTIKGAIWYQGESNVGMAYAYRELFPAMITDWRNTWGQGDFPFYYVQLAPYDYGEEYIGAELREAQFMTLSKLKHTGMAVTMDIGNPNNIHPANKRDVGKRLALWALANEYGQELVYSGPLYREQKIEGSTIRVLFDHTGSGLKAAPGPLIHFEIAGANQVYYPAEAIIDGHTVVVRSQAVSSPLAVRFGWRNTAETRLFNMEGLPASSFCTDNWKRVTE